MTIVTDHDASSDDPMDDPSDRLTDGPRSRVAVVTVWRERSSDSAVRGRLLTEVGPEQASAPVVEYAEGVDEIADLVLGWLVRFARGTDRT